jgi:hypothetical protein
MWDMTDYEPSQKLAAALAKYVALMEARDELREAVAEELKTYDVTSDKLADCLPWTGETVRGIAREYGVPHKRKPTVRSIKPKRRTTA